MDEVKKLSNSLEQTLKDSDLQNVTVDLAESISDALLNDGLLKDIPIIGTIVGLSKTVISLNDRLLIKKLIYFISELNQIDKEKRRKLITEIDNSETQKIKVGEKLLYILDKSEDHLTAKYIAILFKAFLNNEINYSFFLRCSTIIQRLLIQDLEQFIYTDIKDIQAIYTKWDEGVTDFQNSLIVAGICSTTTECVTVRDQDDYKMTEKYIVGGGELVVNLTDIGYVLKNVLKEKI